MWSDFDTGALLKTKQFWGLGIKSKWAFFIMYSLIDFEHSPSENFRRPIKTTIIPERLNIGMPSAFNAFIKCNTDITQVNIQ